MKLAARSEFLFLTSIVYGMAACGTDPSREPAAAVGGSSAVTATNGGTGAEASAGTAVATGAGSFATATESAGNAAPASGDAAAAGDSTAATAGNASAAIGGNTAGSGTAGMAGTLAGSAGAPAAAGGRVTYTAVFALLSGGCATGGYCHASTGGLSKLSLNDRAKSYMDLVGVTAMGMGMPGSMAGGCMTSRIVRVKPGDPDNSLLMQKLEGKQTCGTVMPPGGMLLPDELKLVRDWITAGAKDD